MSAYVTNAEYNLGDSTCSIYWLGPFPGCAFPQLGDLEQGHFTSLCFNFSICEMEDSDIHLPCKAVWHLQMRGAT